MIVLDTHVWLWWLHDPARLSLAADKLIQQEQVTRKTAMRDLSVLVEQGAFVLVGSKRGAHYILAKKK